MSEHTNTQTQTPEVVPSKYLTTTIAVASSLVLAALTGAASTLGVKAVNRLMPDKKGIGKAGALLVQAAHAEFAVDPATVAPALAEELRLMAGWLGLERVTVAGKGDLAAALEAALG